MHNNVNLFDNNAGLTSRNVYVANGSESVTIMVSVILGDNAANHIYHYYNYCKLKTHMHVGFA